MDKKNGALAVLLLVCLILAAAVLLLSGNQTIIPEVQDVQIVISEICAKNDTILADNDGKYRDYVELYNAGEDTNLSGFYLTDGKGSSKPFGDIPLAAGAYRVVFLGDDVTGFALSASGGDCIQLKNPGGDIVFQSNTASMNADEVMVYQDGSYSVSAAATPGFSNDAQGLAAFREGSVNENPLLVISELLTENTSVLPDTQGRFSDMAELHNTTDQPLPLGSFWLSDSVQQRLRYRLPDVVLAAGEYRVIYCDGENRIDENGDIHTNFALSHGEALCLTDDRGRYIALPVSYPGEDVALALQETGEYAPAQPSPGYPNTDEGAALFAQSRIDPNSPLVISEVLLSTAGVPYHGKLVDVVELYNRSSSTVDTAGWYLSDGGDPYAYALPQMRLAPGQCLVLVCDKQTVGFALSEGEAVRLMGPGCRLAQPVVCTSEPGMSISLCDESQMSYTTGAVTLGLKNTEENREVFAKSQLSQGLRISEVVSTNDSYLMGSYGRTCDWLELYNASDTELQLADFALSDDSGNLAAYPLPEKTLAAGEYCVIFLTEDTANLLRGYPVLPFAVSAEGESLYLSRDGQVVDYVMLPQLGSDTAYGRTGEEASFTVLEKPTPEKPNANEAQEAAMPVALTAQGCYDGVEYVDVVLQGEGEIYYTTNGKKPGSNAKRYTGPVRLTKSTAIRAVCRQTGKKTSQCLDLTYVINENDNLEVVCLIADPDDLFSTTKGIYAVGPNANPEFPFKGANFWQDWEREASVSFFAADGSGFSEKCGVKIFGAYSRAYAKKSLACMFRSSYGNGRLEYPLFGDAGLEGYENFVLRAGGQDFYHARMRDELITSLAAEYTDLAVQKYRAVVLYINGEYWGIHYIREKLNEHYVAGNYNVDAEDVIITERNGSDSAEYMALVEYAASHDLRQQEYYDYVCSQMDVDVYMDYMIAQICIGNTDNTNVKFFKPGEGKWHWILYDTDLAFGSANYDSVSKHLYPGGSGASYSLSTALINALLKRPEFKEAFLRRMAWQLETIWTVENVEEKAAYFHDLLAPDTEKDCKRWRTGYPQWNNTYASWEDSVEDICKYIRQRHAYLLGYIQDYFDLSTQQMRQYGLDV